MWTVFLEGFFLQASLIFALGAQNLFIFETGLKRQNSWLACLVCSLCDFFLIMLGVLGAATVLAEYQQLKILFGALGICFLFIYGLSRLMPSAKFPPTSDISIGHSRGHTVTLALTFSLLNPHAYLDAIVLIGGYSSKFPLYEERASLGLGAALFSCLWFYFLSQFAFILRPFFLDKRGLRLVSSLAGATLIFLAGKLSTDVYGWIEVWMLQSAQVP